jgi:hypothetical protein
VPIEDVQLGEQVLATNPETGQTNPETVVATIVGHGDKTLVDITIHTDDGDGDGSATVTATDGHPFWAANRGPDGRWINAADLQPDDLLLAPDGSRVRVHAIAVYGAVATVHNLTITNHHTYYITTADADLLVHNCGGDSPYVGKHRRTDPYVGKHRDPLVFDKGGKAPLEIDVRSHRRLRVIDKNARGSRLTNAFIEAERSWHNAAPLYESVGVTFPRLGTAIQVGAYAKGFVRGYRGAAFGRHHHRSGGDIMFG